MNKYFKNFSKISKHLIALIGCFAILSSFLVLPVVVGANTTVDPLATVQGAAKLPGNDTDGAIWTMIGNLINVALGVLGVLLVLIIIYAGFLWMTARGATDQVKKAKDMILQAVIGLLIIFAAYALTNFVMTTLRNSVGQN